MDVHPGISHVFQTAAFRFGHSLIPPGIYRRDEKCNFKATVKGDPAIRLCSNWWDSNMVMTYSTLEEMLMGMASQLAEKEDAVLCSDIRDKLFGPNEFSRRDLGALNIMRGRDNGLADYNTVRASFNLKKLKSWNDLEAINPSLFKEAHGKELLKRLKRSYRNSIDNIDLYIGGMLESHGGPGPLFTSIILDQFTRVRDADRFWFENTENGMFTPQEIAAIRKITLWDIIVNATDIGSDAIQKNVFFFNSTTDPCPQPVQLNASMMMPCSYLKGFDYFEVRIGKISVKNYPR
uniref:Dual oxidase n=2 Tax=Cacopsylla melanoneura TaxID=428564 RepID=A0A8D9F2V0_9HEMI